ncbi:hypothetical protein ACROYT_G011226 [Oculina patagonica]
MKKVNEILANPHCEVIRPLCVDYDLIEVNEGQCWSIKERRFLENAIKDKNIGHVTPRAFSPYDPTKVPDPKYFREILENSLTEAEVGEFCEDFIRLLHHNQKRHKDKVPCLIGAANSERKRQSGLGDTPWSVLRGRPRRRVHLATQEESSDNSEDEQEPEIGDGVLKAEEKDALRTLSILEESCGDDSLEETDEAAKKATANRTPCKTT